MRLPFPGVDPLSLSSPDDENSLLEGRKFSTLTAELWERIVREERTQRLQNLADIRRIRQANQRSQQPQEYQIDGANEDSVRPPSIPPVELPEDEVEHPYEQGTNTLPRLLDREGDQVMEQPGPVVVDSASQSNTQSPVDSQDLGTHPHLVRRNAITRGEVERLHQHVESLEPGEQQRRIKRINRDANIVVAQLRLSSASNPPTQPQGIEAPANTTVTTHHVQLLTAAIHEFMIRFFQIPSNQDLYVHFGSAAGT